MGCALLNSFLVIDTDHPHQLWDITNDQAAVELVRNVEDAQAASDQLLQHALSQHTTDNVTIIVVRFKHAAPKTA